MPRHPTGWLRNQQRGSNPSRLFPVACQKQAQSTTASTPAGQPPATRCASTQACQATGASLYKESSHELAQPSSNMCSCTHQLCCQQGTQQHTTAADTPHNTKTAISVSAPAARKPNYRPPRLAAGSSGEGTARPDTAASRGAHSCCPAAVEAPATPTSIRLLLLLLRFAAGAAAAAVC